MAYANRFQGRRAVVTGGASGIGLAVAARLRDEGAQVSLWDLNAEALATAKDATGAADVQALDIADPTRWRGRWRGASRRWAASTCWCAAPASPGRTPP